MSHTQHEIKIVIYTPTNDGITHVADIYLNNERIYTGGGKTSQTNIEAFDDAMLRLNNLNDYPSGRKILEALVRRPLSWDSVDTSVE